MNSLTSYIFGGWVCFTPPVFACTIAYGKSLSRGIVRGGFPCTVTYRKFFRSGGWIDRIPDDGNGVED